MAERNGTPFGYGNGDLFLQFSRLSEELFRAFPESVKFAQCRRAFRRKDYASVVGLSIDPTTYTNADRLKVDWLAVNLFKKLTCLPDIADTKQVALEAFLEAEASCKLTNMRFCSPYETPTTGVSAESYLFAARRKIESVLGAFNLDEFASSTRFSSGASTRLGRERGDPYHKFGGRVDVTAEAALAGVCLISSIPVWKDKMIRQYGRDPRSWVNIVPGNQLDFVDKNAKTKRTIAIEPDLNMLMQLGLGEMIRSRLKSVKIDLDDQTRNQRGAILGSLDDSLATLDLKAASDSISYELVRYLLPPDWFQWVDRLRSKVGTFRSQGIPNPTSVTYEKVSSMGNGFTFELESLIFWALSASVVDTLARPHPFGVAVYGDDIIVPRAAAGFLEELLSYCGFTLNTEKSFFYGPFRESCGVHAFMGTDVTPFHLKELACDEDVFHLFNSLLIWGGTSGVVDTRLESVLKLCISSVEPSRRTFVPANFGRRTGFFSSRSDALPRWNSRAQRYVVRYKRDVVGYDVPVDGARAYLRHMQPKHSNPWSPENDRCKISRLPFLDPAHEIEELTDSGSVIYLKRLVKRRFSTTLSSRWIDPPYWRG